MTLVIIRLHYLCCANYTSLLRMMYRCWLCHSCDILLWHIKGSQNNCQKLTQGWAFKYFSLSCSFHESYLISSIPFIFIFYFLVKSSFYLYFLTITTFFSYYRFFSVFVPMNGKMVRRHLKYSTCNYYTHVSPASSNWSPPLPFRSPCYHFFDHHSHQLTLWVRNCSVCSHLMWRRLVVMSYHYSTDGTWVVPSDHTVFLKPILIFKLFFTFFSVMLM